MKKQKQRRGRKSSRATRIKATGTVKRVNLDVEQRRMWRGSIEGR